MSALALALALAAAQPLSDSWSAGPGSGRPSWYRPWRLVEGHGLHVGARPAFYLDNEARSGVEVGAGATLQVTFSKGAW